MSLLVALTRSEPIPAPPLSTMRRPTTPLEDVSATATDI